MRTLSIAASVLALSAGLSAANAQVVSRSISEEPVETIVTQTPEGTVVTRRPLGVERAPYAAPTYVAPAPTYVTPRASTIIEDEPDTVDRVTTREVVRRLETRPVAMPTQPAQTRTTTRTTTKRVVRPPERVVTRQRTTERQVLKPTERIVLTPAERQVVYRTIVEREVVPAPRVIAPAPSYYNNAPVVAADDDDDVYVAPRAYTAGAVLPRNVPLYAVPSEVGYRVPAAQPYSYAYLGGRAYLVDPATSVIVADVTD